MEGVATPDSLSSRISRVLDKQTKNTHPHVFFFYPDPISHITHMVSKQKTHPMIYHAISV